MKAFTQLATTILYHDVDRMGLDVVFNVFIKENLVLKIRNHIFDIYKTKILLYVLL